LLRANAPAATELSGNLPAPKIMGFTGRALLLA
jgi:hypothetical protein